jgi:hypothetical protein
MAETDWEFSRDCTADDDDDIIIMHHRHALTYPLYKMFQVIICI